MPSFSSVVPVLWKKMKVLVAQPCLPLCDPMDCSPFRFLCLWGFSRQEYWNGLPCPPSGDLPNSGTKPRSPPLWADSFRSEPAGSHMPSFSLHQPQSLIVPHVHQAFYYIFFSASNAPSQLFICYLFMPATAEDCHPFTHLLDLPSDWDAGHSAWPVNITVRAHHAPCHFHLRIFTMILWSSWWQVLSDGKSLTCPCPLIMCHMCMFNGDSACYISSYSL